MSIILGVMKTKGDLVLETEIQDLASATNHYSDAGLIIRVAANVGMGIQPYHTHLRSRLESRISTDLNRNMISIDGRVDNYKELGDQLSLDSNVTCDSEIVLAAYSKWGEECFSRLIGDWAISLWSEVDQKLYLARDHAGTRTLYFEKSGNTLVWATYLDTFASRRSSREFNVHYATRYLAGRPIRHLTPYQGVFAVLPAHFVSINERAERCVAHWNWVRANRINYRSDRQYEEHFLELFCQSVTRRDEPGTPIVAQLSGGMDSSANVCVSDHCRQLRGTSHGLVETVSYYDRSEPNWNEEEYFYAVEAQRGHFGIHIDTALTAKTYETYPRSHGQYFLPANDSSAVARERLIDKNLADRGYRAILSGIGGDEVLGGVPTPLPELCDYLFAGRLGRLFRQTYAWCLVDRYPLIFRLADAIREIAHIPWCKGRRDEEIAPWLDAGLVNADAHEDARFLCPFNVRGMLPSCLWNGMAWWSVMETLPHLYPSISSRLEHRYPYLDRDLVEFLFAVPREQLVRPGRRRSLMRRALVGIVPDKVLERRRKAYMHQGLLRTLQQRRPEIERLLDASHIEQMGLVDMQKLRASLDSMLNGVDLRYHLSFSRFLSLELWLQADHPIPPDAVTLLNRDLLVARRANKLRTAVAAI